MIHKGEQCPTCGQYYDRHLVVDGVVEKDGKILLIRRGIEPNKGMMALPGGYIDWNETTEESVMREVLEETGVKTKIDYLIGVYSDPKRDPQDKQNIALAYKLSVVDDSKMQPQQEEVLEVGWFAPGALPEDIAFDHRSIIRDCLNH